jgi:hypothetical protein
MFAMSSGVSCRIAKESRKNELLGWRKESSRATCNVGLSTEIGGMSSHTSHALEVFQSSHLMLPGGRTPTRAARPLYQPADANHARSLALPARHRRCRPASPPTTPCNNAGDGQRTLQPFDGFPLQPFDPTVAVQHVVRALNQPSGTALAHDPERVVLGRHVRRGHRHPPECGDAQRRRLLRRDRRLHRNVRQGRPPFGALRRAQTDERPADEPLRPPCGLHITLRNVNGRRPASRRCGQRIVPHPRVRINAPVLRGSNAPSTPARPLRRTTGSGQRPGRRPPSRRRRRRWRAAARADRSPGADVPCLRRRVWRVDVSCPSAPHARSDGPVARLQRRTVRGSVRCGVRREP